MFKDFHFYFNIKNECCNKASDEDSGSLSLVQTIPDEVDLANALSDSYQIYEITITFDPKKIKKRKYSEDDHAVYAIMNDITAYMKKRNIKYYLLPEYTKNHNLHFHGIVSYIDYTQYNRTSRYIKTKCGLVTCRQIESLTEEYKLTNGTGSYSKWYAYIHKDMNIMNYKETPILRYRL